MLPKRLFVLRPKEGHTLEPFATGSVERVDPEIVFVSERRPCHRVTFAFDDGGVGAAAQITTFGAHQDRTSSVWKMSLGLQQKTPYRLASHCIGPPTEWGYVIGVRVWAAEKEMPEGPAVNEDVQVAAIAARGSLQQERTSLGHSGRLATFVAMMIPVDQLRIATRRSARDVSVSTRCSTFAGCSGGQLGWGSMSSMT